MILCLPSPTWELRAREEKKGSEAGPFHQAGEAGSAAGCPGDTLAPLAPLPLGEARAEWGVAIKTARTTRQAQCSALHTTLLSPSHSLLDEHQALAQSR